MLQQFNPKKNYENIVVYLGSKIKLCANDNFSWPRDLVIYCTQRLVQEILMIALFMFLWFNDIKYKKI